MTKEVFSTLAIALTFIAYAPYIRGILKGWLRPHLFSWVIWSCTTLIVFAATLEGGGGAGAWPIALSGLITLLIAVLAYRRRSDRSITRLDWSFFIGALSALPIWYLSADPLWAVIILTTIDLLGFGPTLRKAYHQPHEEGLALFAIYTVRNLFVIAAMETYSLTTLLFPVMIGIACIVVISVVLYRRRGFNAA